MQRRVERRIFLEFWKVKIKIKIVFQGEEGDKGVNDVEMGIGQEF